MQSTLSYDGECWAMRKGDETKLKTMEMRMLRVLCGKILKNKVSNVKICEMTGVKGINEFLQEQRL